MTTKDSLLGVVGNTSVTFYPTGVPTITLGEGLLVDSAPISITPLKELTDDIIIEIAKKTATAEPGRDGYILPVSFARALEAYLLGK